MGIRVIDPSSLPPGEGAGAWEEWWRKNGTASTARPPLAGEPVVEVHGDEGVVD